MSAGSRRVIGAAAVLGRRFDWALLGPVTGLADGAVVAALRDGTDLQLVVAERDGFRFRHALTHEAVLAGLLPPERAMLAGQALAAAEASRPGPTRPRSTRARRRPPRAGVAWRRRTGWPGPRCAPPRAATRVRGFSLTWRARHSR
jgi:hypothetical protein